MTAFWEVWAKWLTDRIGGFALEILSGVLLATATHFVVDGLIPQALVSVLASLLYESFLDPNGFSWADVGQRAVGIAVGLAAWTWIR